MKTLFLDSTDTVQIGLLTEENKFFSYEHFPNKKSATNLHRYLNDELEKAKIDIKDIKKLILLNGPGSYTGMRIGEGIAQIMESQGVQVACFYHYEVPKVLGKDSGRWISKAYKGEYFVYSWNGESVSTSLILADDFKNDTPEELFGASESIDGLETSSTRDMILKNSELLFNWVLERDTRLEPFYYRSLEEEFTTSKP